MIGVVLNPNALGVKRRRGLRARLEALVGRRGLVIETRTPEDLPPALEEFRAAGANVVATCGGDGTNLTAVSELVRGWGKKLPTLALLGGGTVNTVAHNLGIVGEPDAILQKLLGYLERGEQVPSRGQDSLSVNGLHGFLFASLMGARFLEAYYATPRPGPAWAAVLAARTIASSLWKGPFARWLFSPVEAHFEIDGVRPALTHPRLIVASTVADVGIGMKVAWQASRQPGRFNLIATELSTTQMALQLDNVLAGRALEGGPHLDVLAKRVRVKFAVPEAYTLDGELFRAREVDIAIGPRLWIARP